MGVYLVQCFSMPRFSTHAGWRPCTCSAPATAANMASCEEGCDSILLKCSAHAGMLTQEGQIACECKQCRPGGVVKTPSVSCSEFEEHAGSRERRPAESIYLECIAISLKVLHAALLPDQPRLPALNPSLTYLHVTSSPFNRPCFCLGFSTFNGASESAWLSC